MLSVIRTRSVPVILGAAVLLTLLGGCGSRSKTKVPEAPAAETAQAPAPPTPPPAQPAPAPPAPPTPPAPLPTPHKPPAGRIADQEMLRSLVQGKTTQAEVRELFGVPKEVIMNPAGESFIYYQDRTSGFFSRSTERFEVLTVRFDSKGILKDYEYRYTGQ